MLSSLFEHISYIKYKARNVFSMIYYHYYKKRVDRLNKRKLQETIEDENNIQLKKMKIN